jgi:5-oxoprolinase (ATP-hydrolysing)
MDRGGLRAWGVGVRAVEAPTPSLPLEGRVAAKRPGGVVSASRNVFFAPITAAQTPFGRFATISPSRGEKAPAP